MMDTLHAFISKCTSCITFYTFTGMEDILDIRCRQERNTYVTSNILFCTFLLLKKKLTKSNTTATVLNLWATEHSTIQPLNI